MSRGARTRAGSAPSLALLASLALLLWGCGTSPEAGESTERVDATGSVTRAGARGPCAIVGTAIEAATGEPIGGVRVEAPGGAVATTDDDGRFELTGLAAGAAGELVASLETEDGALLRGANLLRPLRDDRLEVVIYLRPADK